MGKFKQWMETINYPSFDGVTPDQILGAEIAYDNMPIVSPIPFIYIPELNQIFYGAPSSIHNSMVMQHGLQDKYTQLYGRSDKFGGITRVNMEKVGWYTGRFGDWPIYDETELASIISFWDRYNPDYVDEMEDPVVKAIIEQILDDYPAYFRRDEIIVSFHPHNDSVTLDQLGIYVQPQNDQAEIEKDDEKCRNVAPTIDGYKKSIPEIQAILHMLGDGQRKNDLKYQFCPQVPQLKTALKNCPNTQSLLGNINQQLGCDQITWEKTLKDAKIKEKARLKQMMRDPDRHFRNKRELDAAWDFINTESFKKWMESFEDDDFESFVKNFENQDDDEISPDSIFQHSKNLPAIAFIRIPEIGKTFYGKENETHGEMLLRLRLDRMTDQEIYSIEDFDTLNWPNGRIGDYKGKPAISFWENDEDTHEEIILILNELMRKFPNHWKGYDEKDIIVATGKGNYTLKDFGVINPNKQEQQTKGEPDKCQYVKANIDNQQKSMGEILSMLHMTGGQRRTDLINQFCPQYPLLQKLLADCPKTISMAQSIARTLNCKNQTYEKILKDAKIKEKERLRQMFRDPDRHFRNKKEMEDAWTFLTSEWACIAYS